MLLGCQSPSWPAYIVTTSLGLIILKLGAKAGAPVDFVNHRLHFNVNAYTVAGTLLYGSSFLLYVYLISKNDLGYIIPMTSAFVYMVVFVASFLVFDESFSLPKILGISFIVGGLVLINLKG